MAENYHTDGTLFDPPPPISQTRAEKHSLRAKVKTNYAKKKKSSMTKESM